MHGLRMAEESELDRLREEIKFLRTRSEHYRAQLEKARDRICQLERICYPKEALWDEAVTPPPSVW
jgi:chromosome segregation ATPase